MGRWLRVWAMLALGHALGMLAVRFATGVEMEAAQFAVALIALPPIELATLVAAAALGGPRPRS